MKDTKIHQGPFRVREPALRGANRIERLYRFLQIAHKRTLSYLAAIEMHKPSGEGLIPFLCNYVP